MIEQVGAYRIEAEIGRGGMGVVYRATDTRLGRVVAIKALPEEVAADPTRLARFETEARTLASLNHPNLAGIYGVEEDGGARYLVLELIEGETLADRIDRGPLPVTEALDICAQIAAGVEAAHEAGVIHRDLKPANVKITPDGEVKVLDFGLAKSSEGHTSSAGDPDSPTLTTPAPRQSRTIEGTVLGTAAYMSPEQARGRRVDRRTDIWAIGVVLYECLTGDSPFAGETATDTIGAVLHKDIDLSRLPASVPVPVRRVLARMLERDKQLRIRDAGDVWLALSHPDTEASAKAEPKRTPFVPLALIAAASASAAAVLVLLATGSPASSSQDRGPSVVRLSQTTFDSMPKSSPQLTPDGSAVIYDAGAGTQRDIYYQRVGGLNPQNLTAGTPGADAQPALSPDGQRIAFYSDRGGGGVWLMGATGESPRRLTDFGAAPSWSPDGTRLVITTEPAENPYGRGTIASLWIVDVATGRTTEFYEGDAVGPAWSPNGKHIAFWALRSGGQRDLFTIEVNADGSAGEPIALLNDVATDWDPSWSPDGEWLYFSSDRGGARNLWRMPMDEQAGTALGVPEIVTIGDSNAQHASFDRTGRKMMVTLSRREQANMQLAIDPESLEPIGSPKPLISGRLTLVHPAISPDQRELSGLVTREHEDLAIVDIASGSMRFLTNDTAKDRGVNWSPDGSTIAFFSDRSGVYEIWTVRADGSGLTQITDTESGSRMATPFFPVWSADGAWIYFSARSGTYRCSSDGPFPTTDYELIADHPEGAVSVYPCTLSPDGTRLLAMLIDETNLRGEAAVLDLETGSWDLPGVPVRFGGDWIDNNRIVMTQEGGIAIADLQSGEQWLIYEPPPGVLAEGGAFDPENGYVYFITTGEANDLWLLELE